MADYALEKDGVIVNVIVADDATIAALITGSNVIPVIDGKPGVGWFTVDGSWRHPSPYPSWSWDGKDWVPPVPYPSDSDVSFSWDEDSGLWVSTPEVEPSPSTE